jgi:hypothetical protein
VVFVCATAPTPAVAGPAAIRPIDDWLATQGTFCLDDGAGGCIIFVPPVDNYLAWTSAFANPPVLFASMDYAGLANRWLVSQGHAGLGTTFSGMVRERALNDATTEVRVNLHAANVLTWANECCDFATGALYFGARAPDVLAGAAPGLGSLNFELSFVHAEPLGAPLPDLLQVLFSPAPGQVIRSLRFSGNAEGPLHAAYGVPEGTPGRCHISQTGVLHASFNGATTDGFPAEIVELRIVGGEGASQVGTIHPPDGWSVSAAPNPLPRNRPAAIGYTVPRSGAPVRVTIATAAGRRVAVFDRGFEPEGARSFQWDGREASGARVAPGLYFLAVQVGTEVRKTSLLVLD